MQHQRLNSLAPQFFPANSINFNYFNLDEQMTFEYDKALKFFSPFLIRKLLFIGALNTI